MGCLHKGKIPMQEIGDGGGGMAFAQRGRIFGSLCYRATNLVERKKEAPLRYHTFLESFWEHGPNPSESCAFGFTYTITPDFLELISVSNVTLTAITSIVSWITPAGAELCTSSSLGTVVETDPFNIGKVYSQQVLDVLF